MLQVGPAVEIYERPTGRFVADFIGELNFLNGEVRLLKGERASVWIPLWEQELIGLVTSKVNVGDIVSVSIRPEKLQISEQATVNENSLEGVVTGSTYIGSDTHVYVDVQGQKLKVWSQNRLSTLDPKAYYHNGRKVWVTFMPENTLVMPKD